MKFFVDSADPDEIRVCALQGIIHGVSVGASPDAVDRPALIKEICEIFKGPVNATLIGDGQCGPASGSEASQASQASQALEDGMLAGARGLTQIGSNVVVRLPFTSEALKVVAACAAEGIKTNVTRCLSPAQALQAAQAGASYVSPFGDRPDDTADLDLVRKIVAVFKTYGIATEVLVVSVRSANDLLEAALAGAQIATLPFPLLRKIVGQS